MDAQILVFFGLPASGKSFHAEKLSRKVNAAVLSTDVIRKEIFSEPLYSPEEQNKVYVEMFRRMKELIRRGHSVILDASFSKKEYRKMLASEMKSTGCKIHFVEFKASEEIVKKRLNKKRRWSDADWDVYCVMEKSYEAMNEDHLIIDTGKLNAIEVQEKVLRMIREA